MAKWSDYLISGAWFAHIGPHKYVSHVMLHTDNGDSVDVGSFFSTESPGMSRRAQYKKGRGLS